MELAVPIVFCIALQLANKIATHRINNEKRNEQKAIRYRRKLNIIPKKSVNTYL